MGKPEIQSGSLLGGSPPLCGGMDEPVFALQLTDDWRADKARVVAEWRSRIGAERAASLPEPGIIWYVRIEDRRGIEDAADALATTDVEDWAQQVRLALMSGKRMRCVRVDAPRGKPK